MKEDQESQIEMEMWDQEFIDIETEGYFSFEKDEFGSFRFGLVQGRIDYRIEKLGEIDRLERTGSKSPPACNSRKTCRYIDEAYHFLRKIMLHHEMPVFKR